MHRPTFIIIAPLLCAFAGILAFILQSDPPPFAPEKENGSSPAMAAPASNTSESSLLSDSFGHTLAFRETEEIATSEPESADRTWRIEETTKPSTPAAPTVPVVRFPAAFMESDPSLKLNEEQSATVRAMQREFLAEIGGPNQNPHDPRYFERWERAKARLDSQLESQLGIEASRKLQMQAALDAEQP